MRILVDCRANSLKKLSGLQLFALHVIDGLAETGEEIVVDVASAHRKAYERRFASRDNVAVVSDPVQGVMQSVAGIGEAMQASLEKGSRLLKPLGLLPFQRRARWARKLKADVVYYPQHLILPQHDHIPMVTTVHAVLFDYDGPKLSCVSAHMKRSAAIVTSWPWPYQDLKESYSCSREKVFMVPFTVQGEDGESADVDLEEWGVRGEYLLYPSVVIPRKNHRNLIKAYAQAMRARPELPSLVCTGGGKKLFVKELARLADGLGVGKKLVFLGNVPEDVMAKLYGECLGVISASISEAGMAVIQEGALQGKPVICSAIPEARAHAELVGLGVCFFDPLDPADIAAKIVVFLDDIERFRASSEVARAVVKRNGCEFVGSRYRDVFSYAAGLGPRPEWAV